MIKKLFNYFKYLKLNRLKLKPLQSKTSVIMVEFFDMKSFGVSGSYFAHTLSQIHDTKIILYYPTFLNFKQKIIHFLNNINPLSNLELFKSFSNGIVIPKKK